MFVPPRVAIQADGQILVAGSAGTSSGTDSDVALIRYNPDGSLDTTFGTGGKTSLALAGHDVINSLQVLPDGRIIGVGQSSNGSSGDFAVIRWGSVPSTMTDPLDLLRLYAQHDANHNVTALADNAGAVVQRIIYDAYGNSTILSASWAGTTDGYNWVYRYQGGRLESVSGTYGFQRRDFDPATGTWREQDPAGYVDGSNLMQFVQSSPATLRDSSGLLTIGNKIQAIFQGRTLRLGVNWVLHPWNTAHLHDSEDEMTGLVDTKMMDYYIYLAKSLNAGAITGNWKSFTFANASAKNAVGQFDTAGGAFLTTAWWLGGSNDVTAGGTFEVRCVNGTTRIRNVDFNWTWYDRIHGRSFVQGWMDHTNWREWILEGLHNLVADKLLDVDFPVVIDWHDGRWANSADGHPLTPCAIGLAPEPAK